ncbi:MAG: hypothetical protein HDR22_01540 [Lachnospiraceae bacterium]|nr:hypothetical protein [Lachnospiraceae bacterium]
MYHYNRSWTAFGIALLGVGSGHIMVALAVSKNSDIQSVMVLIIIGIILSVIAIKVLIWDWKDRKKYATYKIDKSLDYTFMLTANDRQEKVQDFSQIEAALKELEETKTGIVKVDITPVMGGVIYMECSYNPKENYFCTYVFQQREDGKGYWYSLCDKTHNAWYNLKRLYVKRKMIDFSSYNRKETGEGR